MDWALISYYTTWVYCTGQVLLLIFAFLRYLSPLSRRLSNLKNEINVAASLSAEQKLPHIKRKETEESLFGDVGWAREHFRAYVAAWRDARLHGEERAACSVRLRDFLTPQLVINAASNQRAAEAFPGFFLAGGIFGTFLGIVMGLAGVNLTSTAAPSAMLEGVRAIVEGMKLAFITSLIGIFSSVLFSWSHRRLLRRLEERVRELDSAVCEIFPCLSEEYYERQCLENLIGIKTQMQTLATDIALGISNQMGAVMETAVTSQLSPVLQDIKNVMDRFVTDMDDKNTKAVDEMLNKYVGMLSGTFAGQIESITSMIKDTGEAQANIKEALIQYGERLKAQCDAQEVLVEKTTHAVEYLNQSMEGLSACASDIKASTMDLRKTAELFSQTANSLDGIKDLHEKLDGLMETLTGNVKSLLTHVDGLLARMADALGSQLTTALNSFDDKVAEVLSRFSGTLAETRDTINELPSLLGDLAGSIDKIATTLDIQQEGFANLAQSTEDILTLSGGSIKEAAKNTATATAGIENAVVSLDSWLSRFEDAAKGGLATVGNHPPNDGGGHIEDDLRDGNGNELDAPAALDIIKSLEKTFELLSTQMTELRREVLETALHKIYMTQGQSLDTAREIRTVLKSIEAATGGISKGLSEMRGPEPVKKGGFGGLFGR